METLIPQIETHSTMLRLDQLQVHFALDSLDRFLQPHGWPICGYYACQNPKLVATGGCLHVLAGIQLGSSSSSVAAAPSALSKVHILRFSSSAEASKCMSIHPRPRPASFRSPMKFKTSSCSASCTSGKARNRPNSSSRLRSVPQANSPITKRWQQTPPLSSSVASWLLPFLRWSIHTEVSTSVIMPKVAGKSAGDFSQCHPMLPAAVRSPAQSAPPTLAGPASSFQLCRSA